MKHITFLFLLLGAACKHETPEFVYEDSNNLSTQLEWDTLKTKSSANTNYPIPTGNNVTLQGVDYPILSPPSRSVSFPSKIKGYLYNSKPILNGKRSNALLEEIQIPAQGNPITLTFEDTPSRVARRGQVLSKPIHSSSPYRIRQFHSETILIQENTSNPVQDDRGVLWYLQGGLYSFDGREIVEYVSDFSYFSQDRRLFKDPKGSFWFSHGWSPKLVAFDGKKFRETQISGLPIGNDLDGNVIFNIGNQIFRLINNQMIPLCSVNFNAEDKRLCLEDQEGRLIITGGNSIYLYQGETMRKMEIPGLQVIEDIDTDDLGKLWIAAQSGLYKVDLSNNEVLHFDSKNGLSDDSVVEVLLDASGALWMIFENAFVQVLKEGILIELPVEIDYRTHQYYPADKQLFEDRENGIWLSSLSDGFFLFDQSLITSLDLGLEDEWIGDITQDAKGKIWLSSSKGLYSYNPKDRLVLEYDVSSVYNSQYLPLSLCSFENVLWTCSSSGYRLCRIEEDSMKVFSTEQGLRKPISDIEADSSGILWLGGRTGLLSFDGVHFTDRLPGIEGSVNTLSIDEDGHMIAAHNNLGILRFDSTWTIISQKQGFPYFTWTNFANKNDIIVSGTWNDGIILIDEDRFCSLNVTNGLPDNTITHISIDDNGVCWATTNSGLLAFNISGLGQPETELSNSNRILHFNKSDGISSNGFGYHIERILTDSLLLIPNSNTLLQIEKNRLFHPDTSSELIISSIEVNEQTIDSLTVDKQLIAERQKSFRGKKTSLILNRDQNHLNFHFNLVSFKANDKTLYRYRIKEIDDKWSYSGNFNQADYRNLPNGSLSFEVQSMGLGFSWSKSTVFPFTILPAWYETTWALVLFFLSGLVLLFFLVQWRTVQLQKANDQLEKMVEKRTKDVTIEKEKSEELLLNILPSDVAKELKSEGKAQAREFHNVSVLFTDFKEFTQKSSQLSASELVEEINVCFKAFDQIMEKYGVEKIKTIGDAYMAAGGLPIPSGDSIRNTVLAALEMQDFIQDRKAKLDAEGRLGFEMRSGVHTGSVVAGIVGVKKFQYDIWGDTVNTASRIESHGKVGQVNISDATFQLIKDDSSFSFEKRGKIEVKGKGEMEMFFVQKKEVIL